LVINLFFFSSAIAGAQTGTEQEDSLGSVVQRADLEHPQILSQLQKSNEGEALPLRPEQLARQLAELALEFGNAVLKMEKASQFLENIQSMKQWQWGRSRSRLTPEDERLLEELTKGQVAVAKIDLWKTLEQVSGVMRQATTAPQAWLAYLEQTQRLSELRMLAEPEQLAQQAIDLRRRLDELGWQRMSTVDQQKFYTLQRELLLIADFIAQQRKRD